MTEGEKISNERLAEMPKLPKPAYWNHDHCADTGIPMYSSAQMEAYATAAVAQSLRSSTSRGSGVNGEDGELDKGINYAIERLCEILGVDTKSISWDAATETLDGDVMSVICNVLIAAYGEEWSSKPEDTAKIRSALEPAEDEPRAWWCEHGSGNIEVVMWPDSRDKYAALGYEIIPLFTRPASLEITDEMRAVALRLLQERDERDDKVQDILEDLREIVLLMPSASRPEGLMKKAQDAVYAMRGRVRAMDDAALKAALGGKE